MSEERMIEVATEIIDKKDPFLLLMYLTSLEENEISYFREVLKTSKNFYISIISFCYEYLKDKGMVLEVLKPQYEYGSYAETVFADGVNIKLPNTRRK